MRHYPLTAVTIVLLSSLASAESSAPQQATAATQAAGPIALVNQRLIQPLAAKEHEQSKFSRARLPPAARRVRLLDEKPQHDSGGGAFFAFAVDARRGWGKTDDEANWTKAAITGCVYPELGQVFIKRGKAFHPAWAALGKKTKAAPDHTCTAAAQLSAR